jgi:osmotically-inducible protein OsmY
MWPRAARRNLGNDPKEGEQVKSGSEIREDVINELQWDPQITEPDAIGVAVTDGAVTLTGHVSTYPQRLAVAHVLEWNVQVPDGKVHARVSDGWVTLEGDVEYEYQRQAEIDARHIRLEVSDHTAKRYGHVHSLQEAAAARAGAAAAPGVATVESHLLVSP